jgi:hypothetical protein
MLSWLGVYGSLNSAYLVTDQCCRFSSTIGQFVLTASLRSQVNPENKNEFKDVSPERCVILAGNLVDARLTWASTEHLLTSHWARSCCISSSLTSLGDA